MSDRSRLRGAITPRPKDEQPVRVSPNRLSTRAVPSPVGTTGDDGRSAIIAGRLRRLRDNVANGLLRCLVAPSFAQRRRTFSTADPFGVTPGMHFTGLQGAS